MTIKEKYDAIVVGAGPAGAMCAFKLAKAGKEVLLVERAKMPRNKVCTGMIAIDSIQIIEKEIGEFPKSLCVWPFNYKGFKNKMAKGAPVINMGIPEDEICYSVRRSEYDHWLTLEASKKGATVVDNCAFISIQEKTKDSVTVRLLQTRYNGEKRFVTVKTDYLIAADGMDSLLRKTLFPEREEITKCFCRQDYYLGDCDLDPEHYYYFRYNTAVEEPVWTFRKDDSIVIGYVAYPANVLEEKRAKILDYFVNTHGLSIGELQFSEVCCESTNFTVKKMKNGKLDFVFGCEDAPILFVGEAGEMMDSMSAGIAVAMESGCHAAEAIVAFGEKKEASLIDTYKEISKDMIDHITGTWQAFYNRFGRFF